MINKPPPFKGLNIRIPIIILIKGQGFINQGSGLPAFSSPANLLVDSITTNIIHFTTLQQSKRDTNQALFYVLRPRHCHVTKLCIHHIPFHFAGFSICFAFYFSNLGP